jgi:hypothetical protein
MAQPIQTYFQLGAVNFPGGKNSSPLLVGSDSHGERNEETRENSGIFRKKGRIENGGEGRTQESRAGQSQTCRENGCENRRKNGH